MRSNIHPYNTKKQSFKHLNKSKKRIKQSEIVFQYLLNHNSAETSRSLIGKVNLERGAITRCLNELVDSGKIFIAHNAPCPFSGRKVSWYRCIPTLGQGKLF